MNSFIDPNSYHGDINFILMMFTAYVSTDGLDNDYKTKFCSLCRLLAHLVRVDVHLCPYSKTFEEAIIRPIAYIPTSIACP